MKHRKFDKVYPYTYYIKRLSDGKQYHGVRVANVKANRAPTEDFGKHYFTSGRFKEEFQSNSENFIWKLCFTFDTPDEAVSHEERINNVVSKLKTWANAYGKYVPVEPSKVAREKTLMERYGVDHNFKIPAIAQKRKDAIITRFGVDNPSQSNIIKSKKHNTFKTRYGVNSPFDLVNLKQIMNDRYGVDNPQQSKLVQDKTQKTNLNRYGVKYTFQVPAVKSKIHEKQRLYFVRLAEMPELEFEKYLETITSTKSSQNQKRSIRKKYRKMMGLS